MNNPSSRWKNKLHGALIPAVPVPFKKDSSVDWESQAKYINYLKSQSLKGVAVWAHTGRGLFLDRATRNDVLSLWRSSLPKNCFIVAGVGVKEDAVLSDKKYLENTERMLRDALDGKADLVMPYAPTQYRNHPDWEKKILEYYELFSKANVPIILFYLYQAAGGIEYSIDFLEKLLDMENVVAIKVATLDSVMKFQEIASLVEDNFPDMTLITGEDRFLPYSLQLGAKAGLIGMGAVLTEMQKEMITAWMNKNYEQFFKLSRLIDGLGRLIFANPIEGYIRRILYVLAKLKIISLDASFDPFGPELSQSHFEKIDIGLSKLDLL